MSEKTVNAQNSLYIYITRFLYSILQEATENVYKEQRDEEIQLSNKINVFQQNIESVSNSTSTNFIKFFEEWQAVIFFNTHKACFTCICRC